MMKKYLHILIIFLLGFLFSGPAHGNDLELVIKENKCTDEGVMIKYSFINHRKFDKPNVTAAFKITVDGKTVACKQIKTTVPRGADGSDIKETLLEATCKGKAAKIQSRLFTGMTARSTINNWESDCPR
jgi:hypothetical protein